MFLPPTSRAARSTSAEVKRSSNNKSGWGDNFSTKCRTSWHSPSEAKAAVRPPTPPPRVQQKDAARNQDRPDSSRRHADSSRASKVAAARLSSQDKALVFLRARPPPRAVLYLVFGLGSSAGSPFQAATKRTMSARHALKGRKAVRGERFFDKAVVCSNR